MILTVVYIQPPNNSCSSIYLLAGSSHQILARDK